MDDINKRLMESMIKTEAEIISNDKLSREEIDEQRRMQMDPAEFGGFSMGDDDEYIPEDPPKFEVEEKETESENLDGSDIIADHKYVRNVNYSLSKFYQDVLPKLARDFYATGNPRGMTAINEAVEQMRKIHNDMLNSSKIIEETRGKRKIAIGVGKLSDRFSGEEGDQQESKPTMGGSRRIDYMARLAGMLNEEKIPMGLVPDWAFDMVAEGADIHEVVIKVKHEVEQPPEKEINPITDDIQGEATVVETPEESDVKDQGESDGDLE